MSLPALPNLLLNREGIWNSNGHGARRAGIFMGCLESKMGDRFQPEPNECAGVSPAYYRSKQPSNWAWRENA